MSILGCAARLVITQILCLLPLNEERTCIQALVLSSVTMVIKRSLARKEMSRWSGTLSIRLIISAFLVQRYFPERDIPGTAAENCLDSHDFRLEMANLKERAEAAQLLPRHRLKQ